MTPPALHVNIASFVDRMLVAWADYSTLSYSAYVVLMVVSLIAGALTVQFAGDATKAKWVRCAAIVAFVATGLLNTIDLPGLGTAFRDAWRDVTVARLRYDLKHERGADKRRLIEAYRHGEDTIRRARWWKDNPSKVADSAGVQQAAAAADTLNGTAPR